MMCLQGHYGEGKGQHEPLKGQAYLQEACIPSAYIPLTPLTERDEDLRSSFVPNVTGGTQKLVSSSSLGLCSGFKICPQILRCSSLQKVEPNSPTPECGLKF